MSSDWLVSHQLIHPAGNSVFCSLSVVRRMNKWMRNAAAFLWFSSSVYGFFFALHSSLFSLNGSTTWIESEIHIKLELTKRRSAANKREVVFELEKVESCFRWWKVSVESKSIVNPRFQLILNIFTLTDVSTARNIFWHFLDSLTSHGSKIFDDFQLTLSDCHPHPNSQYRFMNTARTPDEWHIRNAESLKMIDRPRTTLWDATVAYTLPTKWMTDRNDCFHGWKFDTLIALSTLHT